MKAVFGWGIVAALVVGLLAYLFSHPQFSSVPPSHPAASVQASTTAPTTTTAASAPPSGEYEYMEVIDACGPYYGGVCVNLRSGPGTEYPVVIPLRDNMVFKVASTTARDGQAWYQVGFDGEIHYPERVTSEWWVSGQYVRTFYDPGVQEMWHINASSTKRIVIRISKEMLYAYDGATLFMQAPISAGLELTPTPLGTFWVYRKLPDSYMQGPVPNVSDQYYDLPGVPWDLYFTMDGGAIHGAYWHNHFGEEWSHGCVNLAPDEAQKLYYWTPVGTPVIVER